MDISDDSIYKSSEGISDDSMVDISDDSGGDNHDNSCINICDKDSALREYNTVSTKSWYGHSHFKE